MTDDECCEFLTEELRRQLAWCHCAGPIDALTEAIIDAAVINAHYVLGWEIMHEDTI